MAWNPPDPGEMRETVGVEWRAPSDDKRDEYNAVEADWKPLAGVVSRRAKVENLSGREYWNAQQSGSAATYKVTLRYLPGLDAVRYRFLWRNLMLNLVSVTNPDGMKVWHECMCTAKERPAEHRK